MRIKQQRNYVYDFGKCIEKWNEWNEKTNKQMRTTSFSFVAVEMEKWLIVISRNGWS